MSIPTIINKPCEVKRRWRLNTRDDYGNEQEYTSVTETVCHFQQTSSSERSDVSETRFRVFLLPTTQLAAGDAIVVDDETYEVEGDPWKVWNPRLQETSHIEADMIHTSGRDMPDD